MTKQELFQILSFDEKGLIPVIVQDLHAKKVRMLAYMNKEALEKTLETGKVHYYSRSRQALWLKGETSGHFQYLRGLSIDCDGDTLLIQIEQVGGISCHTGQSTCFYRVLDQEAEKIIEEKPSNKDDQSADLALLEVFKTIESRKHHPKQGSYTNYLFDQGLNKILKKVGEETAEVLIAAKESNDSELVYEVADLMYHLSVLLSEKALSWEDVAKELDKRK